MSRPRRSAPQRDGRYGEHHGGRWSSPWVIRIVAVVAVLILVATIAYAAANGFLFALPWR